MLTLKKLCDQYPHLFRETTWSWGPVQVKFQRLQELPPLELIANVNLVPFIQDRVLILQLANGTWEIPGGTLEPGETYLEAAQRELYEEAGAMLLNFRLLGAWHCHSLRGTPYRPHLPFPKFYRLVGISEVQILGEPGNPADGEQVIRVEAVTVEVAAARFQSMDRPDLAELYRLASSLRYR